MKFFNKGQIPYGIVLTIASMFGGSLLWITDISAEAKKADSEIRERVVKLETTVVNTDKNVVEIKEDLRDIKRALNIK